MKAFNIWSMSQFYNIIIWFLVYLAILVINITNKDDGGELGLLTMALLVIITISLVVGFPLVLLFHGVIELTTRYIVSENQRKIVSILLISMTTGIYVNSLFAIVLQDNFPQDWNLFSLISIPSIIASAIATFFYKFESPLEESIEENSFQESENTDITQINYNNEKE